MIAEVLAALAGAGRSLAVAESLTGGALASAVVSVPGASEVFRGGVVTYATQAKADLLGVDRALLAARGAVDPEVALAMAVGVAELFGSDVGVATTGVAGPDLQDGKEPGTVFVAVVARDRGVQLVRQLSLGGDRNAIRSATVTQAVGMLAEVVEREAVVR